MNWRDITHPQAGGAEVHIHEASKRWVKWGHEVTLLCGKNDGCKEDDEIDGVEIIRRGGPFTVYLHAMKEYMCNLRKKDYDIVIDDINGVPFFTPLYVRKPKIVVMHHLVKYIFFKELPWHKAVLGYIAEKTIPFIYHSTPFIAISESTKKDLLRFGIPEENINVIYNGVDREVYKPNLHLKSPYPHIIYLGRIKQYKNLENLLRSMKLIIDYNRLNDAKLTIAGRGDYRELERMIVELGLVKNVDLLGEVSELEKVELYNSAWVFASSSPLEGWGLTIIEANACGTPAITYDVPGFRDSIRDMFNGLLVKSNPKAMADGLIRVLSDDGLRKNLSMNAIEWARRFSWDKTAKQFIQAMRSY